MSRVSMRSFDAPWGQAQHAKLCFENHCRLLQKRRLTPDVSRQKSCSQSTVSRMTKVWLLREAERDPDRGQNHR
eukprot:3580057-Amphidinium_carterae.1